MNKLISEAQELIMDRPEECKIVHYALKLDPEAQIAFMLAWNILNQETEKNLNPMKNDGKTKFN